MFRIGRNPESPFCLQKNGTIVRQSRLLATREVTTPPSPRSFGIMGLGKNSRKIFEFKGLTGKVFENQSFRLSKSAENGFGAASRAVLVDGYTSELPQPDLYRYRCARQVLSQWISITGDFDERSQRLSNQPYKIPRLTRLWNPRSRKARDLGHPATPSYFGNTLRDKPA